MLGALAGFMAGTGMWLVLWRLRAMRPRLPERIAPYLRERPTTSRLLSPQSHHTPFPSVEALLAPLVHDAGRMLERVGSSSASITRRLPLAGGRLTLEQFRVEQIMCAVLGLAVGLVVALFTGAARGLHVVAAVALVLVCGVVGALARDQWLTRSAHRRQERLLTELPAVAEMLALAVSAGEDPAGAMARAARTSRGELSRELRLVTAETRAGSPLATALENLGRRTTQPAVARFVDAISTAVDRGTPLADVLRAQAQDAREAARRQLMEVGGRKEIAMMVPVVFLVLPITVVFALFPGLMLLQVGL